MSSPRVALAAALASILVLAGVAVSSAEPGQIQGEVPATGGVALVSWGGGSIDALNEAGQALECSRASAWVSAGGSLAGHVVGAPLFVNASFRAMFPGGIPENTPLLLICSQTEVPRLLPDLAATPLRDLVLANEGGLQLLRFSSIVINVGDGPFEVSARLEGDRWMARQHLYPASNASIKAVRIPVTFDYRGDGHDHHHMVGAVRYSLVAVDGREEVASDQKVGFCFYDYARVRDLPRAPGRARYFEHHCGHETSTTIVMGISVGWNDPYPYYLPGQSIDITGLPAGRYRLWATVDPEGWFTEASRGNNRSWVEFDLGAPGSRSIQNIVRSSEP